MGITEYVVSECPRATQCRGVCNACWFNCDHLEVTIETFANEEGRIEGVCKSCESLLLSMANGGWEVAGYEFRGEWIRDSD